MTEAYPNLITEEASTETLLPLLPSTYQQFQNFLNHTILKIAEEKLTQILKMKQENSHADSGRYIF